MNVLLNKDGDDCDLNVHNKKQNWKITNQRKLKLLPSILSILVALNLSSVNAS